MPLVELRKLCKSFGPIKAVQDVSFTVDIGEVVGFLGPNGAGKTTTMKILSCFLPPDSGSAIIAGHDICNKPVQVRRILGYVAENVPLYQEMTVAGFLNFVCDIRKIKGQKRKDATERVINDCVINDVYHQPIGTLSKGYRRRVGLAQALIHDPTVLILDEPTDGLDPNQKYEIRRLIKKMASKKATLISTHILEEVDAVCTRIVLIDRGKICANGTPPEVCKKEGGDLNSIFRKLTTSNTKKSGGRNA